VTNREYSALTREQLEERLDAAEDVVVLWSWQAVEWTEKGDATHELWNAWLKLGGSSKPEDNPHLTDELIAQLSARRTLTRAATMQRLRDGGIISDGR
jgi:hypothetical protein